MPQNVAWKYMKEMSQVLLFAELILEIDRNILRLIFLVDFGFRWQRNGFCVPVDVHEMVKNHKVCNQYANTEK